MATRSIAAIATVACFVAALGVASPTVHAQTSEPADASVARERASLHEQAVVATVLYALSAALGTEALITAQLGLIGEVFYPDPSTRALFYGGIVSGIVSLVLLCVGIGLDVDRHARRGALDREAVQVRLVPGPGDLGLGLSFAFALP